MRALLNHAHTSRLTTLFRYIDGAIYRLNYFLESLGHGEAGVKEINEVASTHTITIYPDVEKKNSYCGVDIHDGVLRILFTEDNLGTNIDYALEKIEAALVDAAKASPGLNYTARNSVKQDYQPHADKLTKEIQEQLHNDSFKLNPNFEAIGESLKASKDAREDWPQNLGGFAKGYFESLLSYLQYNKFKEDDLMYEGFEELVTAHEAAIRIVDKLAGSSSYNQVLIEDGKLIIQTTPENFGTNVNYACEKIVDIL